MQRPWGRRILVAILASLCLYSIITMGTYLLDQRRNEQVYSQVRASVQDMPVNTTEQGGTEPAPPATPSSAASEEAQQDATKEQQVLLERYLPLLEENPDTVGWVTVAGTVIDYPVVQTVDNDFYLEHDFKKKRSDWGAIFMDYRNAKSAEDRHTILYGHHMKDGSMFKELVKYADQAFFDTHRWITFNTLYEQIEWEVFAAYETDTSFYYIQTEFRSRRDYGEFLKQLQARSAFTVPGLDLTSEDQILTLSTCSYTFDDARFVVHARRVQ